MKKQNLKKALEILTESTKMSLLATNKNEPTKNAINYLLKLMTDEIENALKNDSDIDINFISNLKVSIFNYL